MKKFTCGHCGGRIAVPPRHLGGLVACPDCGRPTHPLAGEILASARAADPPPRSESAVAERHCENCGKRIGRLEEPKVWGKHVVCGTCHTRLVPPPPPPPPARSRKALPAPAEPAPPAMKALPAPAQAGGTATVDEKPAGAPIAAVGVVADLPSTMTRAAGHLKTLVMSRRRATRVEVTRRDGKDDPAAAAKATIEIHPLPVKYRLAVLLGAAFLAGVFLYGFLALVRDFMWILTTVALVLVAAAVGVALVRVGWVYVSYWMSTRRSRAGTSPAAGVPAAPKSEEATS